MRSTCSAVPARPTPSSRSSVSGVATRVSARTLAYDNSPRARVEPDAPGQPGGARAEPVAPAAVRVEVADEVEQMSGGGIEVGGQLGDLVAEAIQKVGIHRRVSFLPAPTLHPDFPASVTPRPRVIVRRSRNFRTPSCLTHLGAAAARWAGLHARLSARNGLQSATLSSGILRQLC